MTALRNTDPQKHLEVEAARTLLANTSVDGCYAITLEVGASIGASVPRYLI